MNMTKIAKIQAIQAETSKKTYEKLLTFGDHRSHGEAFYIDNPDVFIATQQSKGLELIYSGTSFPPELKSWKNIVFLCHKTGHCYIFRETGR